MLNDQWQKFWTKYVPYTARPVRIQSGITTSSLFCDCFFFQSSVKLAGVLHNVHDFQNCRFLLQTCLGGQSFWHNAQPPALVQVENLHFPLSFKKELHLVLVLKLKIANTVGKAECNFNWNTAEIELHQTIIKYLVLLLEMIVRTSVLTYRAPA